MIDETGPGTNRDDAEGKRPIALTGEIEALIAATKAAFTSELAFQKARAVLASRIVGRIAGLAVLALVLVFFFLMALVVGLLLALAPLLGTWQALGVVVGVLVLGVLLAVWGARQAWRRLKRVLKGDAR